MTSVLDHPLVAHRVALMRDASTKCKLFRELVDEITTFMTMAYVLAVNPNLLSMAGIPRGGVFVATALAAVLGTLIGVSMKGGFLTKDGKLPRISGALCADAIATSFGTATLHMREDAIIPGEKVELVDDLLATGGTAAAAARLVERLGGTVVKMVFPVKRTLEGFSARTGALAPCPCGGKLLK